MIFSSFSLYLVHGLDKVLDSLAVLVLDERVSAGLNHPDEEVVITALEGQMHHGVPVEGIWKDLVCSLPEVHSSNQ